MNSIVRRLLPILIVSTPIWAADWYVSPTGSDAAAGGQATPLATIGQAVSRSANNDRILLQRGGTWRGSFTIGGGRQLLAYGSGANPVVTGSSVVAMTGSWSSNSAVLTGTVPAEAISLWVNGAFQPLARYPNTGFLQTAGGTSLNSITINSPAGRNAGRWDEAQVRWHRWHWFWESRRITSDGGSSGTLSLDNQALTTTGANVSTAETGLVGIPSGFFVCKDLDELDAPGEWFSSSSQVYVYPPSGTNVGTMLVEVATSTQTIVVNGATIRGIDFRRFAGNAMEVNSASTIEDCTFAEIDDTAIDATYNSAPLVVQGCIFRDIRNCGVSVLQGTSTGTSIERNLFQRIGMERGYGGSGTWHHVGVLANVGNIEITLNRLIDIGYAGILLGNTPNNTARRNIIVRSMSTSNDGAGIYTYKGPNTMSENIILDARGDQTAAEPFLPFGNGIWPEFLDGIANSTIEDNTIAGCNGNGIALINNFTCQVNRNVLFDNLNAGLLLDITGNTAAQGHTIDDNMFVNLATTRRLPVEGNLASWYNQQPAVGVLYNNSSNIDFGLMRRSTYVAPAGTQMARADGGGNNVHTSIAGFASAESDWVENSGRLSTQNAVMLINDTEASADMAVPSGTWTRTDGSAVGATVTVSPFRSAVLIGSGSAPASPIYIAASGIDWRQAVPTQQPLQAVPAIAVARSGTPISEGGADMVNGTVAGLGRPVSYDISNLGTPTLTVTTPVTLTPSNCTLSAITQPSTSVGSSATSLGFTVTPTSAGAWSVQVDITSNDPDGVFNWTLTGSASATAAPELDISRGATVLADASIDTVAGAVAGTGTLLNYTLSNSGSGPLTVTTPVAFSNLTNCSVSITSQPATSIAADATSTLTVSITPIAAGAWSCFAAIISNDSNESPYRWTISGTATATIPELAVTRGGIAVADGGTDALGSAALATARTATYTLSNSGSAILNITGPVTFGNASNCTVTTTATPTATIAVGGSSSFSISITATAAGPWSCDLSLPSNDADENPYNWTLSGVASQTSVEDSISVTEVSKGCGTGLATIVLMALAFLVPLRRR